MHPILNFNLLLPIGLLLLQTLLLLFIAIATLTRVQLLKQPYTGMEYSQVTLTAAFLFSVFLISVADIEGLFQAFKTFQNQNEQVWQNTFSKFSQFFLVILLFQLLFAVVAAFMIKIVLGFKNSFAGINEGNIPAAVIVGVILISFALVFQLAAKQVIISVTPQYLNFR